MALGVLAGLATGLPAGVDAWRQGAPDRALLQEAARLQDTHAVAVATALSAEGSPVQALAAAGAGHGLSVTSITATTRTRGAVTATEWVVHLTGPGTPQAALDLVAAVAGPFVVTDTTASSDEVVVHVTGL